MPTPRNLVNLKEVEKGFGSRTILNEVTLGVAAAERIGVVGENGGGKSTLLKLIASIEQPDAGTLTRTGDVGVALLGQQDELDRDATIREVLVGERADHEWAGDRAFRDVLDGLLGGVTLERFPAGMDTPLARLSGGERRRIALARLLLEPPELLLLDEPTNHMDVEGVDWLARHLAARRGAILVVTHDRWFLDAVCTATWEVDNGAVHQYEGGYAAYVLARAERDRQAAAKAGRREQLLRKELAWLRRGPPARTAKPKFRIEAAKALIAEEPQARDRVELAALCRCPPGQQGGGRRPRVSDTRRKGDPEEHDLAARSRRSRGLGGRQRVGQDNAYATTRRRARANERQGGARRDGEAGTSLPGRDRDPWKPARAGVPGGGAQPRRA